MDTCWPISRKKGMKKSKNPSSTGPQLYDITAVDDTKIRRVIKSGVEWKDTRSELGEIIFTHKRRFWNPRIRKHKED